MPVNIEVIAAAENILAQEPACVGVGNRLLHDLQQIAVLATDVDVTGVRSDGDGGDHHAFDHSMRIVFEDQAVFAGAGFAFIPVAQDIFWFGRLPGHERPLHPGAETRAATPAQAGVFHLIDHSVRAHGQGLLHGLIAVQREVAVEIGCPLAKAPGDDLYLIGMGDQVSHGDNLFIERLND